MRYWLAFSGDDDLSPDFYTTEKRAKDALRNYARNSGHTGGFLYEVTVTKKISLDVPQPAFKEEIVK